MSHTETQLSPASQSIVDSFAKRTGDLRRRTLGGTPGELFGNNKVLRRTARAANVSCQAVRGWLILIIPSQKIDGPVQWNALEPIWTHFTEESLKIALERYACLGEAAEATRVTEDDVRAIAQRNRWSISKARRWLRLYREGGLGALASKKATRRSKRKPATLPPDLGTLTNKDLKVVYERRDILGPLVDVEKLSDEMVKRRAEETGVSPRTLYSYWRLYQDYGWAGLAPRTRSDLGKSHTISTTMREVVKGIRLSQRDLRVREVHRRACERAVVLGEIAPSLWQVRRICESIPPFVRQLADGRDREFRNKSRLTIPLRHDGPQVILQFDHTPADIVLLDEDGEEFRPYFIVCICAGSRRVVGARLCGKRPNRHHIAAVLRDVFLLIGLPHEIWVDRGREFIAGHIKQLAKELGIEIRICKKAEDKGIVERFFWGR